jgi:hypothetical protein
MAGKVRCNTSCRMSMTRVPTLDIGLGGAVGFAAWCSAKLPNTPRQRASRSMECVKVGGSCAQDVLAEVASVTRSCICEWLGSLQDCIVATREDDGDFNFPIVPGDHAVSLAGGIDSGTKSSQVLKVPCQSDNTSTPKAPASVSPLP